MKNKISKIFNKSDVVKRLCDESHYPNDYETYNILKYGDDFDEYDMTVGDSVYDYVRILVQNQFPNQFGIKMFLLIQDDMQTLNKEFFDVIGDGQNFDDFDYTLRKDCKEVMVTFTIAIRHNGLSGATQPIFDYIKNVVDLLRCY